MSIKRHLEAAREHIAESERNGSNESELRELRAAVTELINAVKAGGTPHE